MQPPVICATLRLRAGSLLYSAARFYADYIHCEQKDSFQTGPQTVDRRGFSYMVLQDEVFLYPLL